MAARGNGQRIFILVIVAAFFVSSFGFTGYVIYNELNKDKKTATNDQADLQKKLQEQIDKNKATSDPTKADNKENTVKLEGTKIADFTPIDKVTELQKIDTVVGTGDEVKAGDTVTAHYTGALAKDGTIFQSSLDRGEPIPFGLNSVIKGWTEGVPGMKVGGKRRLIIPAELAYGAQSPSANIPANSDLVFDIELVKIGK